jgi:hypothetical protein
MSLDSPRKRMLWVVSAVAVEGMFLALLVLVLLTS